MTRNSIDVHDQYSLPPVASSDHTTSPTSLAVSVGDTGQELINMEEELRIVIVITGIWIAFREGWSKNFCQGDISSLTDSPISPGGRSMTQPKMEKESTAERKSVRSITMNRSQSGPLPTVQSLAAEKVPALSPPPASSVRKQHMSCRRTQVAISESEEVAQDSRWIDLNQNGIDRQHDQPDEAAGKPHRTPHDTELKMKSKGWRRLSSIFGKRK
jgi:hypothetical protein